MHCFMAHADAWRLQTAVRPSLMRPAGCLPWQPDRWLITGGMFQQGVQISAVLFMAPSVKRAVELLTQMLICPCRSCRSM